MTKHHQQSSYQQQSRRDEFQIPKLQQYLFVSCYILKTFIVILFLLFSSNIIGQKFSYPHFNKSFQDVKELVSTDWKLLDTTSGDLNADGIRDLVAILEFKDTLSELRPNGYSISTKPRVLLIFFKNSNGSFNLELQHNTFLLRDGEDQRYEVFPELTITKGVLNIHYDLFHDYPTYKFRYQKGDFYLIGANIRGIHGGNWSEEDINFSTKKIYRTSFYIDNEKNKKVKQFYLKDLKPLKLMDFKMPLTHKISQNYTL